MGQEISQIVFNQELEDIKVTGLSKIQVEMLTKVFECCSSKTKSNEQKFGPKNLVNLLKIPLDEATMVINYADLDTDGCLNLYEFICLVGLFTQKNIFERILALFNLFDNDNSQFVDQSELTRIIKCVISINENGEEPTKAQIEEKINEIKRDFFLTSLEMKLADFQVFCFEDDDFKNALIKIGIFHESDCQKFFNADIDHEINRHLNEDELPMEEENRDADEHEVDEMGNMIVNEDSGNEFLAVKPFLGVVKNSVPSNFDANKVNLSVPNVNLDLEYVYGYRCFDTRNNLFWNGASSIVFHTAAVGVMMDISSNKQFFNFNNTDDILCMAKYGKYIATGQIGHKPLINIWNCEDQSSIEIIIGDLEKGISHVDFSKNGKYLAGVAMNDDHDVAIYDVSNILSPKLFSKSKGVKDAVLHMKFSNVENENKIILATQKEIYYGEFNKLGVKFSKVSGWGSKERQPCLTIGFLKDCDCVIGLIKGELAVVRGKSIAKFLKAHTGGVFAMTNDLKYEKLITGGGDGKICIWDKTFNKIGEVILMDEKLNLIQPKVRAISYNEDTNKLLVGTRRGNIVEVEIGKKGKGRVLLKGHFDNELWGLAMHPSQEEFVTSGEDFLLAKWSSSMKTQLQSAVIKYQSKTVDISPKGDSLAVGCNNGCVLVFEYTSFKQTNEIKVSRKEISIVKFSPDKVWLVVGAHDSVIYVLDPSQNYKIIKQLKGHHSTITHLDFSKNSKVFQSTCTSLELLYWNLPEGKQDTRGASANRDEIWSSWTCTIGWPVQGIYPPCSDGGDVNAVDRNKNGTLCVTSDDFGTVKIFRYPCLPKALFSKFVGHSSHVTNVRFSHNDKKIISVGGNDKSIFQWAFPSYDQTESEEAEYNNEEEFDCSDIKVTCEDDNECLPQKQINKAENDEEECQFAQIEDEGDNEFMAIKPWKGDLAASIPSNYVYKKGMEDAPLNELKLTYVNGYRCFEARETAYLDPKAENVIFVTASLGVQMNLKTNTQSFFQQHDNDVISLALHPNREIAATGQMAQKGKSKLIDIYVWNIKDKSILAHFNSFHLRAIQCLKFSPSGSKLLTYGQDDDNSLAIFDWKKGLLLSTSKVDKTNVLDSEFASENNFYSCGSKHLKYWTFNGQNANGTNVSWKALGNKAEAVISLTNDDKQNILAATGTGKLLLIKAGSISSFKTGLHSGIIIILTFCEETKTFLTGGKDGVVNEVSIEGSKINLIKCIVKLSEVDSINFSIKALDVQNKTLLIGTGGNDIFIIENWQKSSSKKLVLSGHFGQELWGLACSPNAQIYATCGDDMSVKTWSAIEKKMLSFKNVGVKLRAIDFSMCGKFLVAASMCGKLILLPIDLKSEIQRIQTSFTSANQWIEEIKFSPNNQYVAFGAHGGVSPIVIYSFDGKELKLYTSIKVGITSALLHLDWSEDSNNIVLNSQAYELKFVDVNSKQQVFAKGMKDVEWNTWTCKIGFASQGIFPGVMGTEVNSVCRAKNKKVMATGENSQLVKLFKYPCTIEKANFKSYLAHSSYVTRTRFTFKDNFLISAGGHDNTTIIWTTDFGTDASTGITKSMEDLKILEEEENCEDNECFVQKKVKKDKYNNTKEHVYEELVEEENSDGFKVIEQEEENEFMAVKPWLGAIRAPSNPSACISNEDIPSMKVELEYVFGFRSKDCRNNVIYANNRLYYNAAGLGVSLDPKSNTQLFFKEHRDDVISIAYCPTRNIFATGEIGPKPRLFIWDAKNMNQIAKLEGGVIKGIVSLAFSPSGAFLAASCIDDNHHVALFDVNKQNLISCEKGDTAMILSTEFINETEFATTGLRHFKLWKAENPLKATKGNFGKSSDKIVCCKKYKNGLVCGSIVGELQLWSGASCTKSTKVHKTALDAIFITQLNNIVTGGKDCKINVLDSNFSLVYSLDLNEIFLDGLSNEIRAITANANESEVYISTFASEIYKITMNSGANVISSKPSVDKLQVKQLMAGHFAKNNKWTNEIWGLYPLKDSRYLTVSDDGTLRMWSSLDRKQEKYLKLNINEKGVPLEKDKITGDLVEAAKLRSVTVCQEDKHIAVGCHEGTIRLINLEEWRQFKVIKNRKRWISEMRYSPNNELFAVGSHDDFIDIYKVANNYKIMFAMKKHSSFITHFDWSLDSNYIHSNCGAYELLFWDANTGKQLTSGASALKDEEWSTWSCVLGWPVQGIYKEEWKGSDVNMVDRSHTKTKDGCQVLAVADDFSTIRIYKYPCVKKNSKGIILHGHSSHVTNVKFDADDEYLFSTGGEDQTVMQWKVNMN